MQQSADIPSLASRKQLYSSYLMAMHDSPAMKSVSTPDQYCKINDYICGSYRPNKIIATAQKEICYKGIDKIVRVRGWDAFMYMQIISPQNTMYGNIIR